MDSPPKADLRLFQNRYKSIICQEDIYFKELVRYIHLNPLRAKIVSDIETFAKHQYCHCERSEAISQDVDNPRDCFVASLLAMTKTAVMQRSHIKELNKYAYSGHPALIGGDAQKKT